MQRASHIFNVFAALLGFFGVAAGAYAAHAMPDPHGAARVSMAALYALIHAAVLLGWPANGKDALVVKSALLAGTVLFSFALVLAYGAGWTGAARFAPIGGTILLAGWGGLTVSAARSACTTSRA